MAKRFLEIDGAAHTLRVERAAAGGWLFTIRVNQEYEEQFTVRADDKDVEELVDFLGVKKVPAGPIHRGGIVTPPAGPPYIMNDTPEEVDPVIRIGYGTRAGE